MIREFRRVATRLVAMGALTSVVFAVPANAADAFSALKGSWSGGGKASFAGGQTEALRCSARYSGGGSNLSMNLKCASSSAQISLSSNLGASGNKVSGSWSESSFGSSGSANGSATGSGLRLRISGGATGFLNISVAGNRQTVALSSQGTLTGVHISLKRK